MYFNKPVFGENSKDNYVFYRNANFRQSAKIRLILATYPPLQSRMKIYDLRFKNGPKS
jgi:hypothetical protein